MTGVALSQKGMQNLAEDEAIAKRETRIDTWADIAALYPETVKRLEDDDADEV